jgi:hypothetical protein
MVLSHPAASVEGMGELQDDEPEENEPERGDPDEDAFLPPST